MKNADHDHMRQALSLADFIRNDHRWKARLLKQYCGLTFKATRMYEKYITQVPSNLELKVLNFGCGNCFYENAINSDLFAPHRYLKKKRRPDLYWSGTRKLKNLQSHFNTIACEHVVEHILPDDALHLFKNFLSTLNSGGTLIISFPDIRKVLNSNACQGFTSPTVAANSVIYRFGHLFMYDTKIIIEMLLSAGFNSAYVTKYNEISLNQFLDESREVETSYVIASKS